MDKHQLHKALVEKLEELSKEAKGLTPEALKLKLADKFFCIDILSS